MKQIAVIGFRKVNDFCFWCKGRGLELEKGRQSLKIWIDKKNQERYIGIFDGHDLTGRRFDKYIEFDDLRLDLYNRINTKPRTNFDKITESVESLALTISNCVTSCEDCPAYENVCEGTSKSCPAKIRKWLQKECENER